MLLSIRWSCPASGHGYVRDKSDHWQILSPPAFSKLSTESLGSAYLVKYGNNFISNFVLFHECKEKVAMGIFAIPLFFPDAVVKERDSSLQLPYVAEK